MASAHSTHASTAAHRRGRPNPAGDVIAVVLATRSAPPIRPPPTLVSCQCGQLASGQRYEGRTGLGWPEAPTNQQRVTLCLPCHPTFCRMRLIIPMIIPMIIQTIGLDPFRAVWTDGASNLSRPDPSGAIQIDAEHPSRNRKVVGSNPTSGSISPGE
jgi:hypothetical protein